MTELTRKLALRYRLEEEALDVQRKQYALEDSIPHCKYRLREAREKLLSYEAGGFRPFLDKLSGKWADVHDALQSQVRRAEAELQTASRELEQVKADYECRMAELEPLRALDDTGEGLEPREREQVLQMKARFHTGILLRELDRNEAALEAAREWARPNNRVEAVPGRTEALLFAEADTHARACMEHLAAIAGCEILLDIHPYFENPTGYISGVTQFNQLDRISRAMDAIRATKSQAKELLLQLPEMENAEV